MDVYAKLKELNLTLPELAPAIGVFKPVRQAGNCLYVSGQLSTKDGEPLYPGKVGSDVTVEQAQEAARYCVLNALSNMHQFLGDLNKIKGLIKTLAFIQSADGFSQQPMVANGASNLIKEIWGEENGLGARSAIGVNELPRNVCVEVEFIFEV